MSTYYKGAVEVEGGSNYLPSYINVHPFRIRSSIWASMYRWIGVQPTPKESPEQSWNGLDLKG